MAIAAIADAAHSGATTALRAGDTSADILTRTQLTRTQCCPEYDHKGASDLSGCNGSLGCGHYAALPSVGVRRWQSAGAWASLGMVDTALDLVLAAFRPPQSHVRA